MNVDIKTYEIPKLNKTYDFITDKSKDIDAKILLEAEKILKRAECICEFNEILIDIKKAIAAELGIFEFTLVYMNVNDISMDYLLATYNHKKNDIMTNIGKNLIINNTELTQLIKDGTVNPQYLAFMAPHQLFSQNWKDLLRKKELREQKEENICVTDIYTCKYCKEKKGKVTELQLRGADEPASIFFTCLVCTKTTRIC